MYLFFIFKKNFLKLFLEIFGTICIKITESWCLRQCLTCLVHTRARYWSVWHHNVLITWVWILSSHMSVQWNLVHWKLMHVLILNVKNKRKNTINGADYVTVEDWRDFYRRKFISLSHNSYTFLLISKFNWPKYLDNNKRKMLID